MHHPRNKRYRHHQRSIFLLEEFEEKDYKLIQIYEYIIELNFQYFNFNINLNFHFHFFNKQFKNNIFFLNL